MKPSKIYIAKKLNNSVVGIRSDMKWEYIPQWTFAGWPYKRLTPFQARIYKIFYNYWRKNGKPPTTNKIRDIYIHMYYKKLNRMTIYETLKTLYKYGYLYIYNNENNLKCSMCGIISAIWQGQLKKANKMHRALASINPIYVRKHFTLFKEKDRIYPFKEFHPDVLEKTYNKIKKTQE
jgi:hypothetical protein